ncbi:hypothetical protein D3C72_1566280 [compost metagenome]
MAFHGGHGYAHLLSDLAHGLALHQQLQDLFLPLRQFAQFLHGCMRGAGRPASGLGIAFAPRDHQADRRRQRIRTGGLGQIAGHARARASGHHALVHRGVQHQHQPGHEKRHRLR